jgi:dTDP-4-dehydrorhamnose reductase
MRWPATVDEKANMMRDEQLAGSRQRTGCDMLVLGGTGLAGQVVLAVARRRGLAAIGVARRSEAPLDVRDANAVARLLDELRPRIIVNAVAIVSVAACERDPGQAWLVNTRPAALIADYARTHGTRIVHISTDHFYCGDGRRAHDVAEPVRLLNEYARSKHAAELLALGAPNTAVLRTNIVGAHSANGNSFGEWAYAVIRTDAAATLFDDHFVSSIDVWSFAEALVDIAGGTTCGLLNVASSDVFSKAEFVHALADRLGVRLSRARVGSVGQQTVRRPDSLGLDVTATAALLSRPLPTLADVVAMLGDQLTRIREHVGHGHVGER